MVESVPDNLLRSFNYVVEIDGMALASFAEVSGLNVEIEVVEYREGFDRGLTVRKRPGLVRYSNIVLRRGYTHEGSVLWAWIEAIIEGEHQARDGSIAVLDPGSQEEQLRINFLGGWPCKYSGPHLDADVGGIAIETLEICHEGLSLMDNS